ncbi:MAG: AtpZ/AtpI family protein [Candidatus Binatia bacterium]
MRKEGKPDKHQPAKVVSPFAKVAKYLALGLEVPSTIAGSLILGHFLDVYFGTSPWLVVIGAVLGFVAAVVRLVHYLRYFSERKI